MIWGKKSEKDEAKLSGPREVPELVQKYLAEDKNWDPALAKLLRAVERKSPTGAGLEIRVFDESEMKAKKVQILDYSSLTERPDVIIYEGTYDPGTKQVKLEEKKKVDWNPPILSQAEIQQKIEALKEPGSTAFFYLSRGGNHGGPLGMGAAVVELNPHYPGKKEKMYNMYTVDVIETEPAPKTKKAYDSDKPKEVARWVKNLHDKRAYSS